jgi:hypothetical protein
MPIVSRTFIIPNNMTVVMPTPAAAHAASIIQEDAISYILLEDGTSVILKE